LLFVPLTILPAWYYAVQALHSLVIVLWCRVCGWALGRTVAVQWIVTGALFFATYDQHETFYDTRFTALALAVFAAGYYARRAGLIWFGAVTSLLTRETAGLVLAGFGLSALFQGSRRRRLIVGLGVIGLFWYVGSFLLMHVLGGPVSIGRFSSCPKHGPITASCVHAALVVDWKLKLAYTSRLLFYAPVPETWPSVVASLPDLGLTWLSSGVLYDLGWHYYIGSLGILLVGAGLAWKRADAHPLLMRWIVVISLWQFLTTFRLNLL